MNMQARCQHNQDGRFFDPQTQQPLGQCDQEATMVLIWQASADQDQLLKLLCSTPEHLTLLLDEIEANPDATWTTLLLVGARHLLGDIDTLAKEMFAESHLNMISTMGAQSVPVDTAWAADERRRGEFRDWARRSLRAMRRIGREDHLWSGSAREPSPMLRAFSEAPETAPESSRG